MMKYETYIPQKPVSIGLDLDILANYAVKVKLFDNPDKFPHTVICGSSSSGKTYFTLKYIAVTKLTNPQTRFYIADYKGDDSFAFLKDAPRYYSFNDTLKALDEVHGILMKRIAGDSDRSPIVFVWDEYVSNILSLMSADKKHAAVVMSKVSEILLMGRSMAIRHWSVTQRPDSSVYTAGAREQFGLIVALYNISREAKTMLFSIAKDEFTEVSSRGEGHVLYGNTDYYRLFVPKVRDVERMQSLILTAVSD